MQIWRFHGVAFPFVQLAYVKEYRNGFLRNARNHKHSLNGPICLRESGVSYFRRSVGKRVEARHVGIHSGILGKVKTFMSLVLSFRNINPVGVTSR